MVGFMIIGYPLVAHRHHKTMRERSLFLFKPEDQTAGPLNGCKSSNMNSGLIRALLNC